VRGGRAITADTALRLGKYFGLPAQFWMNLQTDYDLRLAPLLASLPDDLEIVGREKDRPQKRKGL